MKDILPIRKKLRLKYYDYSKQGLYFITICIKNRVEILGRINDNQIELTKEGMVVQNHIKYIAKKYRNVRVDKYIVMPNHIHMIISIDIENSVNLSRIIKQYKGSVTKKIGYSIWQKSYYEHIIRDEKEYYKIKEYIQNNIINWKIDKYFQKCRGDQ